MTNRLAAESSPYLLQHAHNPVDWYPWGPEALDRARAEDRPILLSVGYSSCHWCHVMERESFEDAETAELMNSLFVNIKVDREERPDIDQVYMKAVQAMTGSGGWPMTVFLTPDLVPYFGGTYYPPEPRPGIPSFSEVLVATADAWTHRRDQVVEGGARLVEALERLVPSTSGAASVEALERTYVGLARRFDEVWGGFGRAPKFPQPTSLEFLLRYHLRSGEPQALHMAVHTLRRMAAGGVRDHLAGGFHRYSVDARWLVPHFEKMLYDNALLARCYVEAYRLTGSDDLAEIAVETLDWLASDMRDPAGGFYSALDADSEGEEGTYYVWSLEEVEAVLGDDAPLFTRTYDVSPGGNFEGRNILHLPHAIDAIASSEQRPAHEVEAVLRAARARLLAVRERRERPFLDRKVLVAWNGMAIRAFAEAGALLDRAEYVQIAEDAAAFLWSELRADGRLLHGWIGGEAKIHGFLDDHAALGNAFLSLHAATLRAEWLDAAGWLCDEVMDRFVDPSEGIVYDTAADAESLILRPRDPLDGATPSGTALAAELLARAGHLLDREAYTAAADRILAGERETLEHYGPGMGRLLSVLDRRNATPSEIVIAGRSDDPATRRLVQVAHEAVGPGGVIAGRLVDETGPALETPLLDGRDLVDGAPAVLEELAALTASD